MNPYPHARETASASHPTTSPPRTSIGIICTVISAMNLLRLRCPRPARVLMQRVPEHPTQGRAFRRGARPRSPLDIERDAAHEIDARDRHPHERAARRAHSRHLAPTATPKRALAWRYADGMYTRSRWIVLSDPVSAEGERQPPGTPALPGRGPAGPLRRPRTWSLAPVP